MHQYHGGANSSKIYLTCNSLVFSYVNIWCWLTFYNFFIHANNSSIAFFDIKHNVKNNVITIHWWASMCQICENSSFSIKPRKIIWINHKHELGRWGKLFIIELFVFLSQKNVVDINPIWLKGKHLEMVDAWRHIIYYATLQSKHYNQHCNHYIIYGEVTAMDVHGQDRWWPWRVMMREESDRKKELCLVNHIKHITNKFYFQVCNQIS